MKKLRIAVVADIHYGPNSGARLGAKAERLLQKFARAVKSAGADFIIDLGDRVTASSHADALHNMRAVKAHFNAAGAPLHSVLGNHDLRYLSATDNESLLGTPGASYSFDSKGWRFICFNPQAVASRGAARGVKGVSAAEMNWLRREIAAAEGSVIVLSHVPLDNNTEDEAAKNALRDGAARAFYYEEGPEIRKVLEESGKVKLCLSGHLHRDRQREINGINYVTQRSLTGAHRRKYNVPCGTWSWLEIDGQKISLTQQGKTPKTYEFSF